MSELDDDEIIRLMVVFKGKKTSISMDATLAYYLGLNNGGIDSVRAWAKATVVRLEREWNDLAVNLAPGERVRAKTGLSRAIQREGLILLMEGLRKEETDNAKT